MAITWDLGVASSIAAYGSNGKVIVHAKGDAPTPCHFVCIVDKALTGAPDGYKLVFCKDEELVCLQVQTPFEVVSIFQVESDPRSITIHTKKGEQQVQVQYITPSEIAGKLV